MLATYLEDNTERGTPDVAELVKHHTHALTDNEIVCHQPNCIIEAWIWQI